jgi:hypothetical protein
MELICSSELLVTTYKTTQHHNLKDHNPYFHCHEELKKPEVNFYACILAVEETLCDL